MKTVFESGVADARVLYYVILTLALTRNVWTGIRDPGGFGECSLKKEEEEEHWIPVDPSIYIAEIEGVPMGLPKKFAWVFQRCLQKNPSELFGQPSRIPAKLLHRIQSWQQTSHPASSIFTINKGKGGSGSPCESDLI